MAEPTAGELSACDAIVFDCDGVLVDSETLANDALRSVLGELGWVLSTEECKAIFVGRSLPDTVRVVREHFLAATTGPHAGGEIGGAWTNEYKTRRNSAIEAGLTLMPGILPVLYAAGDRFDGRMAVASNSPRGKLDMQLRITGLDRMFDAAHVFSGMDQEHPKPAPDVYLAAAASLDPPSAAFAVLEDSPTGVRAGVAAGAYVMGLSTIYPAAELAAAGAAVVRPDLAGIAALL